MILFHVLITNKNILTCLSKWQIFTILLSQPIPVKHVKYNPIRVVVSTWIMAAFILSLCYGSCIYSKITLPQKIKIDSINTLVNEASNNNIKLISLNGTATHELIIKVYTVYNSIDI